MGEHAGGRVVAGFLNSQFFFMEYKFRGFSKDFNKWVYGSQVTTPNGSYILEEGDSVEFLVPEYHSSGMGCGLEDRGITDRYESMEYGFERAVEKMAESYPPFIEVIPESVGLWTGFSISGTDIYKDDIIQGISLMSSSVIRGVVFWDERNGMWKVREIVEDRMPDIEYLSELVKHADRHELELVGNIHDLLNPLEGERINTMFDPNNASQPGDELKKAEADTQATDQVAPATETAVGENAEEGSTEG